MKPHIGMLFGALALIPSSGIAAEAQVHACTLLTADEIGSAVSGVSGQVESNMPWSICTWIVGARDTVSLSVIAVPQDAQPDPVLADLDERLKAAGFYDDTRDIGNAKCFTRTQPPPTDIRQTSGCTAVTKGKMILLDSESPTKPAAMEQLKVLLDKAIARLP